MIEAELQAVLSTLKEHEFQDSWGTVHTREKETAFWGEGRKGDCFLGRRWPVSPKLVFD
jgi:hypothetical protein